DFHMSGSPSRNSFTYRVAVARTIEDAEELVQAHLVRDDIKIGELLGFPKRSAEFFDKIWKDGYFDPIWQQAINTSKGWVRDKKHLENPKGIDTHSIRIHMPNKVISSVLRYIGVRILSHMPDSMDDKDS